MAKTKGIPNFKHTPPAPTPLPKADTVDETVNQVLAAIRTHEPEVQNAVFNKVMQELAVERHQTYDLSLKDQQKAAENFEKFMATTQGINEFVKEYNSRTRV